MSQEEIQKEHIEQEKYQQWRAFKVVTPDFQNLFHTGKTKKEPTSCDPYLREKCS